MLLSPALYHTFLSIACGYLVLVEQANIIQRSTKHTFRVARQGMGLGQSYVSTGLQVPSSGSRFRVSFLARFSNFLVRVRGFRGKLARPHSVRKHPGSASWAPVMRRGFFFLMLFLFRVRGYHGGKGLGLVASGNIPGLPPEPLRYERDDFFHACFPT